MSDAPEIQQAEIEPAEAEALDTGTEESSENPAWAEIKSTLPESFYESIKPTLAKWDKNYQTSVDKAVEKQFGWAKELQGNGVTPDRIQQALLVADRIETDPAAFHKSLSEYLQKEGRLPETPAEMQEVIEDAQEGTESPFDITKDPQFKAMKEQLDGLLQMQQQSQSAQQAAQVQEAVNAELTDLRQAHPELDDADVNEVMRSAMLEAMQADQDGGKTKIRPLAEHAAQYIELQNRILSRPRAASQAPRLVPTSGGVPATQTQSKSLGQLSSDETQSVVASYLSGGK